ncbi:alcohol dehydrogenase catalytic domain-containing protein, partial [Halobium palmae]
MRAARLHEYTDDMSDALRLDDVDRPSLDRPDGVLVEVAGAGWCQTDNHIVEGMWTDYVDQELPMTLGHESAGVVREIGDDVTLVSEGDAVICHPHVTCGVCRACRQGEDMHCENAEFPGLSRDGGFAEYLATAERSVVPLPEGVDPV